MRLRKSDGLMKFDQAATAGNILLVGLKHARQFEMRLSRNVGQLIRRITISETGYKIVRVYTSLVIRLEMRTDCPHDALRHFENYIKSGYQ